MGEASEIVHVNGRAPVGLAFSSDQRQMIRDTYANGASDAEFAVLMEVAKARSLNPLLRQAFFVQRWDSQKGRMVWAVQVSIDGLRAIAERTGRYEGQTAAQWCDLDGAWVDVWLKDKPPAAARVGVYKQGFREPAWGVARWTTYVPRKKDGDIMPMWNKMPDLMLAKCAEALALRKAFPEDTSGLYTDDEMAQAESPRPVEPQKTLREKLDAKVVEMAPPGETVEGEVVSEEPEGEHAPSSLVFKGGKYAGLSASDPKVPASYLTWLLRERKAEAEDPAKEKRHRFIREDIGALEAELARRGE